MTKQFEMNVPDEIRKEFLTQCGYYSDETPGFVNTIKYANLCATWGANQEYEAAHQYILGAVGEGNARIYQEKRRPRILTEKDKAFESVKKLMKKSTLDRETIELFDTVLEALRMLPDDDT